MAVFQKAFVLIKVSPGHEEEVVDNLMKITEVTEVHIVPGNYDLLAVVSSKKEVAIGSDEKVYRLVLEKIEKIKYVTDTNTMVSQFSKTK
jgi:DNA-binding Lrp family transcriptional regulator